MNETNLIKTRETLASIGLVLVAIGLVAPFAGLTTAAWMTAFKWIFGVGALIYFAARLWSSFSREGSKRLRRLRRMEMWAGVALMVAAGLWFYNTRGFDGMPSFHMLRDTIAFTMAAAVIQIVATWLIGKQERKEFEENNKNNSNKENNVNR